MRPYSFGIFSRALWFIIELSKSNWTRHTLLQWLTLNDCTRPLPKYSRAAVTYSPSFLFSFFALELNESENNLEPERGTCAYAQNMQILEQSKHTWDQHLKTNLSTAAVSMSIIYIHTYYIVYRYIYILRSRASVLTRLTHVRCIVTSVPIVWECSFVFKN